MYPCRRYPYYYLREIFISRYHNQCSYTLYYYNYYYHNYY